jgi:hypothetical protein
MRYYPVIKNWNRKIRPHLENPEVQRVLVRDFNKYTMGQLGLRFRRGQLPREFGNRDWLKCFSGRRRPQYVDYVSEGACHWLVNFNLKLAQLAEPTRPWRILTSSKHSTVWDGDSTLFDPQFLALGVDAATSFQIAQEGPEAIEWNVGQLVRVGLPTVHFQRKVAGLRVKPLFDISQMEA